ncbi:hypothetical protein V6Z12_D09G150300 [Gossypium hirsutum]
MRFESFLKNNNNNNNKQETCSILLQKKKPNSIAAFQALHFPFEPTIQCYYLQREKHSTNFTHLLQLFIPCACSCFTQPPVSVINYKTKMCKIAAGGCQLLVPSPHTATFDVPLISRIRTMKTSHICYCH